MNRRRRKKRRNTIEWMKYTNVSKMECETRILLVNGFQTGKIEYRWQIEVSRVRERERESVARKIKNDSMLYKQTPNTNKWINSVVGIAHMCSARVSRQWPIGLNASALCSAGTYFGSVKRVQYWITLKMAQKDDGVNDFEQFVFGSRFTLQNDLICNFNISSYVLSTLINSSSNNSILICSHVHQAKTIRYYYYSARMANRQTLIKTSH